VVYRLPVLPPELTGPPEGWAPKEGFSPSALASYAGADGCKRRWAWGALFGVWSLKKSIATLLGSLIHGSLEHYLRGGTVYDLNGPNGEIRLDARTWREFEIMLERGWLTRQRLAELAATAPERALAGICYLPNPKGDGVEIIETEQWVNIDTTRVLGGVERIKINAKIDLRMRRVGIWYLYDHKSTKGKPREPWCYIKTPEQLKKDPQAVFYALDLILRHNLDGLWIRWVYYLTDPKAHPLAKAVDVELSRAEVMEAAYEWLLVAHEMRGLVRAAKAGTITPNDVPANLNACDTFGGCTYHYSKGGPCQPAGEVNLGDLILAGGKPEKETQMGLAEKLAETKGLVNGTAQAPMIPPMPLVSPEAQAAPAAAAPALPPLPTGWHYHNNAPRPDAPAGFQYDAAGGVVPIPPPAPAAPPVVAVQPPVTPPAAVAEAPKKGGRPKGAKNKPKTPEGETAEDDDVVDSIIDRLINAANGPNAPEALRTLTIAQINAIREALENE
jgi:hypothetical protein